MAFPGADLPMLDWLLDVGCKVNAAQPKHNPCADGGKFGGLTPLACATSAAVVPRVTRIDACTDYRK